eukprot:TRINITY_DN14530_c0_g1_i1.p1 TRINITY_DN14530_c0_g1~~TRINITY_DN14530_c0_g1_i1.p1  ORF type:complete len:102 (+),score=28.19 TRINITY_DN14530_c0_g1_i1:86-391(+)
MCIRDSGSSVLPALAPARSPGGAIAASSSSVVLRNAQCRNQSHCDTIAQEIAVAQAAAAAAQRLAASKKKRHNVVTISVPPGDDDDAVSYTHLTLPTIYSV